jgi:hypothetical protein
LEYDVNDITGQNPPANKDGDKPRLKSPAGVPRWLFRVLVIIGGLLGFATGVSIGLLVLPPTSARPDDNPTFPNSFLASPLQLGFASAIAGSLSTLLAVALVDVVLAKRWR